MAADEPFATSSSSTSKTTGQAVVTKRALLLREQRSFAFRALQQEYDPVVSFRKGALLRSKQRQWNDKVRVRSDAVWYSCHRACPVVIDVGS